MKKLFLAFATISCGAMVTALPLLGQSQEALRQRYGEPTAETFVVRPGIVVTVSYSDRRRITELLISRENRELIKSRGRTLSHDSVNEIIDELVPVSSRGKYIMAGFVNMACLPENDCYGTTRTYEKVTIYYNAAAAGQVHYAVVQWKE